MKNGSRRHSTHSSSPNQEIGMLVAPDSSRGMTYCYWLHVRTKKTRSDVGAEVVPGDTSLAKWDEAGG